MEVNWKILTDLIHTAFSNPDGTTSLVVYNSSDRTQTFDIVWQGKTVSYTLPARSASSLLWDAEEITIPVTDITLNHTTVELISGETLQLTATVLPENATIKTVRWFSDNEKVAQVDDFGKIKAIKSGNAVITATSEEGNKTNRCQVSVNEPLSAINFFTNPESNYFIYPNPTKGQFYVQSDHTDEKSLSLYSASGQLMLMRQFNRKLEEMNITEMDNCIYIVKIEDKEDTIYTKLIKN